jgi:hypothetical protein
MPRAAPVTMATRVSFGATFIDWRYLPLFVTLGAATEPEAPRDFTIDGFWMGLSKRSLQVA